MKLRFVLAALVTFASPLCAQEYLEPADTTLEQYQQRLRSVLHEAFNDDVKARVLIVPSFRPESVTGLRQKGETWEVFTIRPQEQIWLYEILDMMKAGQVQTLGHDGARHQAEEIRRLEASLPPSAAQVPLTRCVATLDAENAATITQVWRHMLSDTREPDEIGLDGVSYYFSVAIDGRELTAKAWSPNDDSRVGRLVVLAGELENYCQTNDRKHLHQIGILSRTILKGR